METATPLSKTVRVSNEELGTLQRRVNEIVRRVEEGTIELAWVMKEIQRVVEGRVIPEVAYSAHARPLEFKAPSQAALRRSAAPLSLRTEQFLQRLKYPERNPERIMAEVWEALCIPDPSLGFGRTPINAIVGENVEPSERDVQVN